MAKPTPKLSTLGKKLLTQECLLTELWKLRGQHAYLNGWLEGLQVIGVFEKESEDK